MGDTMSLCRFDEGSRLEMTRHPQHSSSILLSLLELEDAIQSHFRYDDPLQQSVDQKKGEEEEEEEQEKTKETNANNHDNANPPDNTGAACYHYASNPPLQILTRYDSHWLDCRRPYRLLSTVFGMEEELDLTDVEDGDDDDQDPMENMKQMQVQVDVFQPKDEGTQSSNNFYYQNNSYPPLPTNGSSSSYHPHPSSTCSCQAPHRNWKLQDRSSSSTLPSSSSSSIRWMDVRSWQRNLPEQDSFLKSPAAVTHFLRSLLGTAQDVSLWVNDDDTNNNTSNPTNAIASPSSSPHVVALLLTHTPTHLLNFRVGDASPSFYLHSVCQLQHVPYDDVAWWSHHHRVVPSSPQTFPLANIMNPTKTTTSLSLSATTVGDATLLVYRKLSPRDHLSIRHPKDPQAFSTPKGCLWETYYYCDDAADVDDDVDKQDTEEKTDHNGNNRADHQDNVEKEEEDDDDDDKVEDEEQYRLLAPPYVSSDECFPGVLDPLLTPESLAILRQEALSIAHWTAWPEKQHYRSTNGGDASYDSNGDDAETTCTYPASWTVFPLCYCFPANDASALKWIPATCQLVPGTVALLQQHDVTSKFLRTALFSRLDPETTLEPHVGWADLANHVLRVHIPLVVPPGGLCGTWVDGCVETHEEGRLICLDDGKLHRAFNYSKQPRIVLIVDLARPSMLPLGTATGGHSDELDQFIEQMGGGEA